jgi:RimJ/RimL family protein N-acetyltransferase
MIEFQDLFFRAIELEDLDWIQENRNRPEIRQYYREYREVNSRVIKEWFDRTQCGNREFTNFIVCSGDQSKKIGIVGLNTINWKNRVAEINISIFDDSLKGKGIGKKMINFILYWGFDILDMNRIFIECYSNNPAIEFYKKCGFKIEGELRETYYYEGKFYNSYIGSVLKNEYDSHKLVNKLYTEIKQ